MEPSSTEGCAISADDLFRRHSAFIRVYLKRLYVPDVSVDDGVQEVFLVAHRLGGYQPGPAKPKTWLCAIALRIAANIRRRHSRANKRETAYVQESDAFVTLDTPYSLLEQGRTRVGIQRAFGGMRPMYQRVFEDCIVNGTSCLVVAERLQIPVGTVYSRLHSARKEFILNLEGQVTS